MARNVYGLDLGTYEVKIYDKKSNDIYTVKDTIAFKDEKSIIAIGNTAYEMYEKSPANIEVVFPMKEGVISRYNDMQFLLNSLLKNDKKLVRGAEYVIAIPTDVTEVDKKAFFDLLINSNANPRGIKIIDRGVADAIGLGIDAEEKKAVFIANLGAETMELSVVSYGEVVLNKLVRLGALQLDQGIQNLLRAKYDFLIGERTARTLRETLGFFGEVDTLSTKVTGRNIVLGIPQQQEIKVEVVRTAMKEPLNEFVREIRSMLNRIPPDIQKIIQADGIYLVGGLSALKGLDYYLSELLEIPIQTVDEPKLNAIDGIAKIINSKELKDLTYSMSEGKYRWMK